MFPRRNLAAFALTLASLPACITDELRDRYASVVDEYLRAPALDPASPAADPARALGPPDGRTLALGVGGAVTLRFFREIPDGPGPDLRVYEVGPDGAAARVAVSDDGAEFIELDVIASGTTTELDLSEAPAPSARFVRVRGTDDLGIEPGFDLDAVEALH